MLLVFYLLGKLCSEEIASLEAWFPHVEESDEKRLAHEGEDEMTELAERFQNRFPQILPEVYTNSTFKVQNHDISLLINVCHIQRQGSFIMLFICIQFRYTATQRTSESARHFTVGLFGRRVSQHIWFPEAIHRDPIIRVI